jgi:hypothetical protein
MSKRDQSWFLNTTERAKKNTKKAGKAAKRKQTLKHLPKKTRQARGKHAAKSDNLRK